jgi:hypothetical protein
MAVMNELLRRISNCASDIMLASMNLLEILIL